MKYLGGLILGAAAAAVCAGLVYRKRSESGRQNEPVLRLPNPFVPASPDDFEEQLGLRADAPHGADHISYSVLSKNIANIAFQYAQYQFTLRVAESNEDVSGLYGQVLTPETVDAERNAVLESVLTGGISRRLTWCSDGIYYTLINTDGADAALMRRVYADICAIKRN